MPLIYVRNHKEAFSSRSIGSGRTLAEELPQQGQRGNRSEHGQNKSPDATHVDLLVNTAGYGIDGKIEEVAE